MQHLEKLTTSTRRSQYRPVYHEGFFQRNLHRACARLPRMPIDLSLRHAQNMDGLLFLGWMHRCLTRCCSRSSEKCGPDQSQIRPAQSFLRLNHRTTCPRRLQSLQIPTVWPDREGHAVSHSSRPRVKASSPWARILKHLLERRNNEESITI